MYIKVEMILDVESCDHQALKIELERAADILDYNIILLEAKEVSNCVGVEPERVRL